MMSKLEREPKEAPMAVRISGSMLFSVSLIDKNTKNLSVSLKILLGKWANTIFATSFNNTAKRMLSLHKFTFNPFSENTYLLWNEKKEAVIIDPGMIDNREEHEVIDFIREHKLTLKYLIATHTHLDHVFGNAFILKEFRVPFIAHTLADGVLPMATQAAKLYGIPLTPSPMPDQHFEHGDTFKLGDDTLEVRFAPGHAPDHVVFVDRAGKRVIGGDVLFQGSVGRTDLPGGDAETLFKSIREQLYSLPDDFVVYSGHGPETTIGQEKRSNPFVRV